ncbi:MAG: response regulator [Pseudomonadota bacterium]
MSMRAERAHILVVDDDEVSVMAIRRALEQHGIKSPIICAADGQEALDLLMSGAVPKPRLILLDINMPRMNGLEFLAAIRKDTSLRNQVVFVMTTSDAPQDIAQAYSQQIAGYILKEDAYRSIGRAIEMLGAYIDVVALEN